LVPLAAWISVIGAASGRGIRDLCKSLDTDERGERKNSKNLLHVGSPVLDDRSSEH
jgi:hypothetical protein